MKFTIILILSSIIYFGLSENDLDKVVIYHTPSNLIPKVCTKKMDIEEKAHYEILVKESPVFRDYLRFMKLLKQLKFIKNISEENPCVKSKIIFHYNGVKPIELYLVAEKRILFQGKLYKSEKTISALVHDCK